MSLKSVGVVFVVLALATGVAVGVILQHQLDVISSLESLRTKIDPFGGWTDMWAVEDAVPRELQGKLALFILAGQSSMSGRGDLLAQSQDRTPRVFVFGNDYRWRVAREPVDDPRNQVDRVSRDPDAGFGPSLAFATTLLEQCPDLAIGLIPCARGGSSIYQWQRNLSENSLYGSCLKRTGAATTMGKVAAILFFQGEADAIDPELYTESVVLPDEWGDWFVTMVNDWREDLGMPDLPVVYAQIGTHAAPEVFVHWAAVKEQQSLVQLPHSAMITTDDLALKDGVHFTSESYKTIGERFAEAYLSLTRP
jgi:hypothetical protein